jgi:hypothetical protein
VTLIVRNWQAILSDSATRVSAEVDGFEVWLTVPGQLSIAARADVFLAMALLPAMARGEAIRLEDMPPVSEELLPALEQIQVLWTCWNNQLRHVAVAVETAPSLPANRGDFAFFSGGVDATHTALEERQRLTGLVAIAGFDFDAEADAVQLAAGRLQRAAGALGLPVWLIETNWIAFARRHHLARLTTFGATLAGIGLLLAPKAMVIPSTHSFDDLRPHGSHPLLDPLWSTRTTRIEHIGCHARRAEKVEAIVAHPELLPNLWVCHREAGFNCGACPKCLRLRVTLALLGRERDAFPDASGDPVAAYTRVLDQGSEEDFLQEIMAIATFVGDARTLERLRRARRRFALRRWAADADRVLLGGRIGRRLRVGEETPDLRPWGPGPAPEY